MASSVSRWKSSKSTCMVFTNVDADMVWAAMAAASRISSSVAPKSFAASVWKSVQYLHRVAPDTARPISSLYLFGMVVSASWKSRMVLQNPSSKVAGISSTHPGTFPKACLISARIFETSAALFSTVAMCGSFPLLAQPGNTGSRAHRAHLGAIRRLLLSPVICPLGTRRIPQARPRVAPAPRGGDRDRRGEPHVREDALRRLGRHGLQLPHAKHGLPRQVGGRQDDVLLRERFHDERVRPAEHGASDHA